MKLTSIAGTEPGQRQLNGPQTTGRNYTQLSEPQFTMLLEPDTRYRTSSGNTLLADVYRPNTSERVPALVAASPYPRQIQNSGAPMGFVEAGATDFFVPRGYAHVIVNTTGTGGSTGTFGLLEPTERRDLADVVEEVAAQPWCNGRVGMVGISYFAMAQLAAASEQPPHLQALFAVATTTDMYELTMHNGVINGRFMLGWLTALSAMNSREPGFFRNKVVDLAEKILKRPKLHAKFGSFDGESALRMLGGIGRLSYDSDPWDELYQDLLIRHPYRDDFWDERDLTPLLSEINVPTYFGCDWDNVGVHMPTTFKAWNAVKNNVATKVGMLGTDGLSWPWESLHVEALAWFDHWLKDRETGIMDGDPIRMWIPGAERWETTTAWPPPDVQWQTWHLASDGTLVRPEQSTADDQNMGLRMFQRVPDNLRRPHSHPLAVEPHLVWSTEACTETVDIAGPLELRLIAASTSIDPVWIVTLEKVGVDGKVTAITSGWLRGVLRGVDEEKSELGIPCLPARSPVPVQPGEFETYRIPIVDTALQLQPGERLQIILASNDTTDGPAKMNLSHTPPDSLAVNTIRSDSCLLIPIRVKAGR